MGKRPIANKYREGKMKRTLKRESKGREIDTRETKRGGKREGTIQGVRDDSLYITPHPVDPHVRMGRSAFRRWQGNLLYR